MTAARYPLPFHESIVASNEPPTVTLTVRVHDYIDEADFGMGGRLEGVVDESGNYMQILGLDPGVIKHCPKCNQRVYLPDAFEDDRAICPYVGCHGIIGKGVAFGDVRVEDVPSQVLGGDCPEHGSTCRRGAEVIR